MSKIRALALIIAELWMVPGAVAGAEKLTAQEIARLLTGKTAHGESGGQATEQVFRADGTTFYNVGAGQSQGHWEVRGDRYCSQWPPGEAWECYDVVRAGSGYEFVSASGNRYRYSISP